jgi:hypothetical protein
MLMGEGTGRGDGEITIKIKIKNVEWADKGYILPGVILPVNP